MLRANKEATVMPVDLLLKIAMLLEKSDKHGQTRSLEERLQNLAAR